MIHRDIAIRYPKIASPLEFLHPYRPFTQNFQRDFVPGLAALDGQLKTVPGAQALGNSGVHGYGSWRPEKSGWERKDTMFFFVLQQTI